MSLRAAWRRTHASSIAIALLIGVIGAFTLAAASTARRVDGAYQSLLAEVDAPDLVLIPACGVETITGCDTPEQDPAIVLDQLEGLTAVEQARNAEVVRPYLLGTDGRVLLRTPDNETGCADGDRSVAMLPRLDGGPNAQAVPFRLSGTMPEPDSFGAVLTRATGERVGLGVGDEFDLAGWCTGDGDAVELPRPLRLVVTGLSIGPFDIEPPGSGFTIEPTYVDDVVFDALVDAGAEMSLSSVAWLADGSTESATRQVEGYDSLIDIVEQAANIDTALDADARPLWVLSLAGAVIGLLVLVPILQRSIGDDARDIAGLAALGADCAQIARHVATRTVALTGVGVILAMVFAPLLAARLPVGLGGRILSDQLLVFDTIAMLSGAFVLVAALAAVIGLSTWRVMRAQRPSTPGIMATDRVVSPAWLRPTVQTGVAAAIGRPVGRRLTNPWPGVVSLGLAVAVGVAGLTYIAGFRHLEQTPRLTGWNWDMIVDVDGDAAQREATMAEIAQLEHVDRVTSGTLYPPSFLSIPGLDFQVWPWSFDTGPDAITPTMLSGRAPQGPDEIAIDPVFVEFTGLEPGDTVVLARPALIGQVAMEFEHLVIDKARGDDAAEAPDTAPILATFEITGVAMFSSDRTQRFPQASMTFAGLSAYASPSENEVADALAWLRTEVPDDVRQSIEGDLSDFDIENRLAYVRSSGDVATVAAQVGDVAGVSRVIAPSPEEVLTIVNSLNIDGSDRAPLALAYMASIAALVLGVTLLTTVLWARRFELSLLRALGMSGNGVRSSLTAQAMTIILMVFAIGVPVGLIAGRWAWLRYASDLEVIEESLIPTSALAIALLTSCAVAVVVAMIIASFVIRRSAARDLRAE